MRWVDFGGNPAAARHADDRDILEVELVEQIEIEIGEVVDVVERPRLLGAGEARMAGRDQVRLLGQAVEHGCRRIKSDAGMEEEERAPAALVDRLDADTVDRERSKRRVYDCGHPGRFPLEASVTTSNPSHCYSM
jgi:hypothetical protein